MFHKRTESEDKRSDSKGSSRRKARDRNTNDEEALDTKSQRRKGSRDRGNKDDSTTGENGDSMRALNHISTSARNIREGDPRSFSSRPRRSREKDETQRAAHKRSGSTSPTRRNSEGDASNNNTEDEKSSGESSSPASRRRDKKNVQEMLEKRRKRKLLEKKKKELEERIARKKKEKEDKKKEKDGGDDDNKKKKKKNSRDESSRNITNSSNSISTSTTTSSKRRGKEREDKDVNANANQQQESNSARSSKENLRKSSSSDNNNKDERPVSPKVQQQQQQQQTPPISAAPNPSDNGKTKSPRPSTASASASENNNNKKNDSDDDDFFEDSDDEAKGAADLLSKYYKKEQEEKERLERERIEKEKEAQERQEKEKREREEKERQEKTRKEKEEKERREKEAKERAVTASASTAASSSSALATSATTATTTTAATTTTTTTATTPTATTTTKKTPEQEKKRAEKEKKLREKQQQKELKEQKAREEKERKEKAKQEKKMLKAMKKSSKKNSSGELMIADAAGGSREGATTTANPLVQRQHSVLGIGQANSRKSTRPGGAGGAETTAQRKKGTTLRRKRPSLLGGGTTARKGTARGTSPLGVTPTNKPPARGGIPAFAGGPGGAKTNMSAQQKRAMLGSNMLGLSIPNLTRTTSKRRGLTFIEGFNPLGPNLPSGIGTTAGGQLNVRSRPPIPKFEEMKQAEFASRKEAMNAKPARGYTSALLDYQPPADVSPRSRTPSFFSTVRGKPGLQKLSVAKRGQLASMKEDKFWFSTVNFIRDREEAVRKSKVDSLESQLSMKWDDFMESLPKIQQPGYKRVRDNYDAQGIKQLESQGNKFLSALRFTGGKEGGGGGGGAASSSSSSSSSSTGGTSLASKYAAKGGVQAGRASSPLASNASSSSKNGSKKGSKKGSKHNKNNNKNKKGNAQQQQQEDEDEQAEPDDEANAEVINKVVMPSYLQGFTGEEVEEEAPPEPKRRKYAIDIFTHANPNIAVDAKYDELFGECAAEDPGVYIWRIEYFMPIEIPEDEVPDMKADPPRRGVLYSEDCYLVLHISDMDKAKRLVIYTWIGHKATLDKIGAAAIRSRELNIFLKNKANMHREIQEEESDDFLELYDYDIEYRDEDGTETGFKPALPFVQEPRLYRLTFRQISATTEEKEIEKEKEKEKENEGEEEEKSDDGNKKIVVAKKPGKKRREIFVMTQVRMSMTSFNQSDVFVLDGGTDGWIWQWNGSRAGNRLKFKGHEVTTRINRYERNCSSTVCVIDEGDETWPFWRKKENKRANYLGISGNSRSIVDDDDDYYDDDDLDDEEERCFLDYMLEKEPEEGVLPRHGPEAKNDVVLCKTSIDPETGKPSLLTLKKADEFSVEMSKTWLETKSAYIMDAVTELYVWIGKRSSALERQIANAVAQKLRVREESRPKWAPINVIYEGCEPTSFISKFSDWVAQLFAPLPSNFATSQHCSRHRIAESNPPPEFDIDAMLAAPLTQSRDDVDVDDCTGSVEVWAIEDGKPTFTKLPPSERGHFYSGDCYLVLYTYYDPADPQLKQSYLCYFWEGRSSSNRWYPSFLFGFYPVLEKKIKTHGGRPPLKIRVAERKEPSHFLKLFGGQIVIYKGHRKQKPTLKPKKKELFHVRRTSDDSTHTIQVKAQVKSMTSRDAFVLRTPSKLYLWYGTGTSFNDSASFLAAANLLLGERELETFDEGEENPDFWNALGGWSPYMCDEDFIKRYDQPPRLYCFGCSTGQLAVEEILGFFQTDLVYTNVYLLDTQHEVYIWNGAGASESLYIQVLAFANKYVREMALKRKRFVDLVAVENGQEPVEFTRHFHTWVTRQPFQDPILQREEMLADLLFQEYKMKEAAAKKKKEQMLKDRARLELELPLLKMDWIEVIRREIPDLVVDHGELETDEEEYSSGEGEYMSDEEEILYEDMEEEEGNGGDEGEIDEDEEEELVYEEMPDEVEEAPVKKEKSAAEYLMEKVYKSSKHYRMYHS